MVYSIVIFVITYILMIALPKYRVYVALSSAAVFLISGLLPWQGFLSYVDFNVLMMIAGTMGAVSLFIESKMPNRLADIIIDRMPNVKWAIVALCLFAGIISAFVDNVATVLMVAPVALAISKRLDINPVPVVISIAVSSNLQGAATLVGDTTSILLGGAANMNFLDFFIYHGKPSMFFATELGALVSVFMLLVIFRKDNKPISAKEKTVVTDYFPTIILAGIVVLLILASFIPNTPAMINGIICVSMMAIGIIYEAIRKKSLKSIVKPLKEIDFETIGLLFGLFIVIGAIEHNGVIDALAEALASIGGSVFLMYTVIVWASVLISAFVDNIPYVATMLPVVAGIASKMSIDPTVLYFGLLIGATLGGNMTPIGASANITGIGLLRKEGYEVKNKDFFKIGIPFTLCTVIAGYVFIWLMFGA